MITLIQDTLTLWRDAERVLDHLPPGSPDHETVARLVVHLSSTYARLTTAGDASMAELERSRATVQEARALLRRVRGPTSELASAEAAEPTSA
jgi:hypothetical protein